MISTVCIEEIPHPAALHVPKNNEFEKLNALQECYFMNIAIT